VEAFFYTEVISVNQTDIDSSSNNGNNSSSNEDDEAVYSFPNNNDDLSKVFRVVVLEQ